MTATTIYNALRQGTHEDLIASMPKDQAEWARELVEDITDEVEGIQNYARVIYADITSGEHLSDMDLTRRALADTDASVILKFLLRIHWDLRTDDLAWEWAKPEDGVEFEAVAK